MGSVEELGGWTREESPDGGSGRLCSGRGKAHLLGQDHREGRMKEGPVRRRAYREVFLPWGE